MDAPSSGKFLEIFLKSASSRNVQRRDCTALLHAETDRTWGALAGHRDLKIEHAGRPPVHGISGMLGQKKHDRWTERRHELAVARHGRAKREPREVIGGMRDDFAIFGR